MRFILHACIFQFLFFISYVQTNPWKTARATHVSETFVCLKDVLYLEKYGYIDANSFDIPCAIDDAILQEGLKKFQEFVQINVTGTLDDKTLGLMGDYRCGNKDIITKKYEDDDGKYNLMERDDVVWDGEQINYNVLEYPLYLAPKIVDREVEKAFHIWSRHLNIIFEKNNNPDIQISFVPQLKKEYGTFNGKDIITGISSYPGILGDIYLKYDEYWSADMNIGINLQQVLVHQIGHILGLDHRNDSESIMYPLIKPYEENFTINTQDVKDAQAIYGTHIQTVNSNNLCNDPSVDAMFTTRKEKYLYAFKGKYFWKITNNKILPGYPKLISERWKEIDGHISGGFQLENGWTYIFKNDIYWKYLGRTLSSDSPQSVQTAFTSGPSQVTTTFIFNKKIYLVYSTTIYVYEKNPNGRHSFTYQSQMPIQNTVNAAIYLKNISTSMIFTQNGLYGLMEPILITNHPYYNRHVDFVKSNKDLFGCY